MLFLLLGVVFATWAARIPAIRDALQLSPAQLGAVLLCGGLGAVVSFPVAAWLVGHHGARRGAGSSGLMLIAVLPLLALAPNMALLMLSMVLFGTAQTSFNVAINAVGAQAERTAGRSLMSRLHAWYCIGAFGGALLGSGLAGSGVPAAVHFGVVALLLALPLSLSHRALPFDHPQAPDAAGRFALPKGPLLALGVICFGAAIAEGTITDWSGVYMRDQLGATEGQAPLAFGAFSGLMVGMRLAADRLKDGFGARRVVTVGTLVASAGMALVVAAWSVPLTIGGFALAGAGFAAVFPFLFSAAGRQGPTALAGVATMGYSGVLIGPPVIGFVAHGLGLQAALAIVAVIGVAMAAVASRSRALA
jgi:MFS family permease